MPNVNEKIQENVNVCSSPSELKITDIRVANITGAPKHCPLITNAQRIKFVLHNL